MSKRTKKWLSWIMTLIMIFVSVPIPELKVHAAGSGIWVGDTELVLDTPVSGEKGSVTLKKKAEKMY